MGITYFFNEIFYRPLFNVLILIYQLIPDFGISVILLTLLIRFILCPVGLSAIKSQKALSELQPKIKDIQEKYKNDKEKQAKELLDLYQREKINPFSGIISVLIQLPVLIAMYWVFQTSTDISHLNALYGFMPKPESINYNFLGLINLTHPNIGLALLAGILQYYQAKLMAPKTKPSKKSDFADIMQKQALYVFPFFTIIILFKLPSAIGLYWSVSTLFSLIQQYFFNKKAQ